jgi:transcriptional regulator GlxA family with amidase domain
MEPGAKLSVGILVFPEVEVLDFTGPLEAFSCVGDVSSHTAHVFTLALDEKQTKCRSNLIIEANYTLKELKSPMDILVIPGGMGVRKLLKNPSAVNQIRMACEKARIIMSVCTGSLLLAKMGMLAHKACTTHHTCFLDLKKLEPTALVKENVRFCDNGNVLTAGGISAGIDLALYVIGREWGKEVREAVVKEMEWIPNHHHRAVFFD